MTWADALAILTLQGGHNTTVVLIGVTLLGAAAGLIGSFAVLRGRALISDTLGHAALPGICAAFLVAIALGETGRALPVLLAGAAASGLVGVVLVNLIAKHTRLPEDAAMAIVLSVGFGLGFVLLSYIQTLGTGSEGGLASFVLGQTAGMRAHEAWALGAMALLVLLGCVVLFKEFRLLCFDRAFMVAQGGRPGAVDLVLLGLVTVVTVAGLRVVGLVMIIALLVIPAAAARFWTERLGVMVVAAAAIGALAGYLGATTSALTPDLPAGPVIVLTAGALFLISLLLAPSRGLAAAALRRLRLRLQVARSHLLRALFEQSERTASPWVDAADLRRARGWSALGFTLLRQWLIATGLLHVRDRQLALTARGQAEALRIVRNHRLWELYLVRAAALAPTAVDRSADAVEHVLSADLVRDLEAELEAHGRWPQSVHPLGAAGPG